MDVCLLQERVAELQAQKAVLLARIEQLEHENLELREQNLELREQLEEALRAAAHRPLRFVDPNVRRFPRIRRSGRGASQGTLDFTASFLIMWTSKLRYR